MWRWAWMVAVIPLFACAKADLLNLTISRDNYTVMRDVAYGDGPRHTLDIYVPEGLKAPAPVVVFYYGGSWQKGSKHEYLFAAQALVSEGYIVVVPDYRLYPEVYFPSFVEDSARAFVWVKKHIRDYNGDTRNLYVAGHSAGAFNALMLAANEAYLKQAGGSAAMIRGVIGIAGPYDFLPMTDPDIIALFSKVPERDTQPIRFVTHKMPPVFLATGTADDVVHPKNSRNVAAKLKALHSPVELKEYAQVGHIGIVLSLAEGFRGKAPLLEDITAFIERTRMK